MSLSTSRLLPACVLALALALAGCGRTKAAQEPPPPGPGKDALGGAVDPGPGSARAAAGAATDGEALGTLAPEVIKIGSYNMAILASTKTARPRTMEVLALIAADFDVMAMQEVGSNGSTASDESCVAAMEAYTARINQIEGGDLYAYVRGDQYAFVYRKDRLELKASGLYQGTRLFTYTPLVAWFQVRGRPLDFLLLTIHTRPSLAGTEVPSLAAAMDEVAGSYGEADVLCLGDFNADGSYYAENPAASADGGGGPSFLAGFPPGRYVSLVPNDADTTVAAESLAYDRMELTMAMSEDYAGSWGVVRPGEVYDLSECEGSEKSAGSERALSDHYPIWAEFNTTRDRD